MALIRLRVCAGWSELLLVAHSTLLEISCHGSFYVALPCLYIKSLTFPLHYGKCKNKNIAHLRDYPHPVQGQGHGLHVTNDWCIMSSTVLNDLSSNKFPKFKIFSHKYFFRSKKSSKLSTLILPILLSAENVCFLCLLHIF